MKKPLVLCLLGRSGCGKGTQAEFLVRDFGLTHIGSGEMLRALAKQPGFMGEKTNQYLRQGKLVPSSLIIRLWINKLDFIKNSEDENFKGILFDGIPRMPIEAKVLLDALDWYEWKDSFKAVLIDISHEEAFNRLTKRRICKKCGQLIPYVGEYKNLTACDKCGGELMNRSDDKPEAIEERLSYFKTEVKEVLDIFEKEGLLVKVNGEQSIEDVYKELLEKIK